MNFDTSNANFTESIRKLEITDPNHADTFNTIFEPLLKNDVFIKKNFGDKISTITQDMSSVIFQLALQNIINTSDMKHIFVDKFSGQSDVILNQGIISDEGIYI